MKRKSKEINLEKELEIIKKSVLKESSKISGIKIKGPNFEKKMTLGEFISSYQSLGIQASNIYQAIQIIKEMKEKKSKIFLAYTSNMITSGVREIIKYLVKNKHIDVLITTAGGIEEDIIKCFKPFYLGSFDADDKALRKKGVNRAGNIFIPNDRYMKYEEWINPILDQIYEEQKKTKNIICVSELIQKLGQKINNQDSVLYWAYKNKVPVFCPAITDGSTGDMLFFFKQSKKDFVLDISKDSLLLINEVLNAKKTGIIILGGGVIKHHLCNANLFRDGADYAVYINSQKEFDGSDTGARVEEAISWGKVKTNSKHVKVYADASIAFPLIIAGAFALK